MGPKDVDYRLCTCNPCNSLRKKYLGELPPETETVPLLEGKQLIFCPPRVLGFNIKQKEWVQLLVDSVKDIEKDGRRDAWDKLELAATRRVFWSIL
jgi:hypothetical protein